MRIQSLDLWVGFGCVCMQAGNHGPRDGLSSIPSFPRYRRCLMDHLQLTTFGQRHNWLAWPILHANPAWLPLPNPLKFSFVFFFFFFFGENHEFFLCFKKWRYELQPYRKLFFPFSSGVIKLVLFVRLVSLSRLSAPSVALG